MARLGLKRYPLAVLLLLVVAVSLALASDARASDAETDSDSRFRWQSLRPGQSLELFYQAATLDGDPLPTGEALLLLDAIENKWEPKFGHHDDFEFTPVSWESPANVTYWRMPTQDDSSEQCNTTNQLVSGCFVRNIGTWDSSFNGYNVQHAIIPYGPHAYHHSNSWLSHMLAHEWGHGLTLKHHGSCNSVMNGFHNACFVNPANADVHTALDELGF